MLADQFLERWIMRHIDSGTQDADVGRLAHQLGSDGAKEGIYPSALERAAGRSLEDHLKAAIREAIEEELR
jgi:hypothetical protein